VTKRPLSLTALLPDAERKVIAIDTKDAVQNGIAERLAVVLRSRGQLLMVVDESMAPADVDLRLVRFRPPVADAGIALLALLTSPQLVEMRGKTLGGAALLGIDDSARVTAALALEATLLLDRRILPILTVERGVAVDENLRGVRFRSDGALLIDNAWWSDGR
jgi:hypothetical protein